MFLLNRLHFYSWILDLVHMCCFIRILLEALLYRFQSLDFFIYFKVNFLKLRFGETGLISLLVNKSIFLLNYSLFLRASIFIACLTYINQTFVLLSTNIKTEVESPQMFQPNIATTLYFGILCCFQLYWFRKECLLLCPNFALQEGSSCELRPLTIRKITWTDCGSEQPAKEMTVFIGFKNNSSFPSAPSMHI
jgi:hypothetical protein